LGANRRVTDNDSVWPDGIAPDVWARVEKIRREVW